MTEHRSAAASLYPHLPSADPQPRSPRQQSDLASVMYPALSREAKAQQAWQARAQAEQKARNKRLAERLQAITESLRRERGR